jgi:hypothetical protein
MRACLVVFMTVLACEGSGCSCGRELLGGAPDDGDNPDAAARDDAGGVSDAHAPPDSGTCSQEGSWRLEPRRIAGVRLLEGDPSSLGATERLVVDVQLTSSCDVFGWLEGEIQVVFPNDEPPLTFDEVRLAAFAWVQTGPCLPVAPVATTVFVVPGRKQSSLSVEVLDVQDPDEAVKLAYDREPVSEVACGPTTPAGPVGSTEDCLTDCSCQEGLSCIRFLRRDIVFGDWSEAWACLRPCRDSIDCGHGAVCTGFVDGLEGPRLVCQSGRDGLEQCGVNDDCPDGYLCVVPGWGPAYCADQRPWPDSGPCECDADCGAGAHCVRGGPPNTTRCELWCEDQSDCPSTVDNVEVVCADGICVQAYER